MKKKIYIYDQFDPKKNRFLYQYSNFYGKKFLDHYFFSRKKFTSKISKIKKNNKIKKLSKKKIFNLCRDFEVKKRIYLEPNKKKQISLSEYVILSNQILNFLKKKMDYSILSTYLKINDFISFCYKKRKSKKINRKINKIFQDEIELTKKLINVKIK